MSERRKVLELFNEQKDYFEKRYSEGIEKHRKGDATVILKSKDGNLLKNTDVLIKQTSHAFKYGANIFMLDELETEEKNNKYKEIMAEFGNMVTLPFYWDALEPEKGNTRYSKDSKKIYRRPPIDLIMEFCQKQNIEPREHALAYDHFFPVWLKDSSVEEVKEILENRFREIADRYKDKIPTIEVTNEMFWQTGHTSFYKEPDFVQWCFKTAEKYFPKNQLVINEYTHACWLKRDEQSYPNIIENTLKSGARIDAIGMQYHMFFKSADEYNETRQFYSPEQLYKQMDLYSQFGKPLQITEVTIPAYSWNDEDESVQAEIIENLYKIWFSHENVEQIIYWNMIDGYAHVADATPEKISETQGNMSVGENYFHGGLLRFDMTPKPAYYTIKNLFEKVWHTEEILKTNEIGTVNFKGFFGNYEITVNDKKYNVSLNKNSKNEFIIEV